MNNDAHLQALIEKSMQLQIIQSYKYPEHDIDIHDGLLTVAQKAQIQTKKKPQIKKK